jgi:hypothetical protein
VAPALDFGLGWADPAVAMRGDHAYWVSFTSAVSRGADGGFGVFARAGRA